MISIFKFLVVIVIGFLAFRFWSLHQHASPGAGSGGGFATLPDPWVAPPDHCLVVTRNNATQREVYLTDQLAERLTRDGIHFERRDLNSVAITYTREPGQADAHALGDIIKQGALPLVFVSGKYCNNPSSEAVEAEYRRTP